MQNAKSRSDHRLDGQNSKVGVVSGLATLQPELMDASLDWIACISIDFLGGPVS
jgi:hypothetical protein